MWTIRDVDLITRLWPQLYSETFDDEEKEKRQTVGLVAGHSKPVGPIMHRTLVSQFPPVLRSENPLTPLSL